MLNPSTAYLNEYIIALNDYIVNAFRLTHYSFLAMIGTTR